MLDVLTLIGAAKGVTELAKEAVDLAGKIRSGLRADNEEAKAELAEKLAELQRSLSDSGKLAEVAERYMRIHQDIRQLLDEVERAQHLVGDNLDEFRNASSARHAAGWRVLETMFSTIDGVRHPVHEAVFNRIDWVDERDKEQIQPQLLEFDSSYRAAEQALRLRGASEVRNALDLMVRPLQKAETLVRSSLYGEILPALQSVGRTG